MRYFAMLLCWAAVCAAQSSDVKFYKLDFVIKEVEGGKAVNARTYSMTVSTEKGMRGAVRTGSKLPVQTPGGGTNFYDVGVNIDVSNVQDMGADLAMVINADLSTAQPSEVPTGPSVIRSNRWSSPAIVALKRPSVVFSSDDLTTKRQMQLEVTAAPMR